MCLIVHKWLLLSRPLYCPLCSTFDLLIFLFLPVLWGWMLTHHSSPLSRSSPLQLAAASARPAQPWRAVVPPPAGSRRSDSLSSGRSVCVLLNTKRRRGSDSGRIWGSGSSCAVDAAGALETGPFYSVLCPGGSRAAACIRQDLSHQPLLQMLVHQLLLWSVTAGLLPAERTSMTNSAALCCS